MAKILALDLMSKLGWACRAPDGGIIFGTETFRSKGIESARYTLDAISYLAP